MVLTQHGASGRLKIEAGLEMLVLSGPWMFLASSRASMFSGNCGLESRPALSRTDPATLVSPAFPGMSWSNLRAIVNTICSFASSGYPSYSVQVLILEFPPSFPFPFPPLSTEKLSCLLSGSYGGVG